MNRNYVEIIIMCIVLVVLMVCLFLVIKSNYTEASSNDMDYSDNVLEDNNEVGKNVVENQDVVEENIIENEVQSDQNPSNE